MSFFENLFGKGKLDKEIKDCEQELHAKPEDPVTLKKLGDLYIKAHDNENASAIYLRLGETYNEKGFYPKAIALYKQAQKINPAWEMPYEKLAILYESQGFARDAAAQYVRLSELMEQCGESEKAITYMQKAAELDPEHKQVSKQAKAFGIRDHEKAMMEKVPNQSPKPAQQQTDFFNLNAELEKEIDELKLDEMQVSEEDAAGVAEVFKAMEANAAEEGADDPIFLYNMGLAYRETGLLDDAVEAFKKVINTGDKLFDAHIMLGTTYREQSKYQESLDTLKQGASLSGISNEMKIGLLYEVGQTYKAMGLNDKALEIFRNIQNESKDFKDVDQQITKLAGGG